MQFSEVCTSWDSRWNQIIRKLTCPKEAISNIHSNHRTECQRHPINVALVIYRRFFNLLGRPLLPIPQVNQSSKPNTSTFKHVHIPKKTPHTFRVGRWPERKFCNFGRETSVILLGRGLRFVALVGYTDRSPQPHFEFLLFSSCFFEHVPSCAFIVHFQYDIFRTVASHRWLISLRILLNLDCKQYFVLFRSASRRSYHRAYLLHMWLNMMLAPMQSHNREAAHAWLLAVNEGMQVDICFRYACSERCNGVWRGGRATPLCRGGATANRHLPHHRYKTESICS